MPQTAQRPERYDPLFEMYDTDSDGFITQEDHNLMAQRVLESFNHSPTSPKAHKLQELYAQAWEIVSVADTDGDGRITRDEFRAAMTDYAGKKDLFEEKSRSFTAAEFAAADADDDGVIDRDEFTRLATAFGYSVQDAEAAFAHLDQDGDGRISHDEYYGEWHQYATSPSPDLRGSGSSIFG